MNSQERTYQFSLKIINFLKELPQNYSNNIICKQLIRSATSICANISEAQASPSRKDFANFFSYALKSAHETKYWLRLLKDTNKSHENDLKSLIAEVCEIANILGSSILTLKNQRTF